MLNIKGDTPLVKLFNKRYITKQTTVKIDESEPEFAGTKLFAQQHNIQQPYMIYKLVHSKF